MKSILENRSQLAREIEKVAEVAGYLWVKGWAKRNGGNITVNITEWIDEDIQSLPAISPQFPTKIIVPNLLNCYFYCKGTNKRIRDLARQPMENGSIIRICNDCMHYEIVADQVIKPTSEIPAHLDIHNFLVGKGSEKKAVLHANPIELIAMSHRSHFLEKDVLTRLLWSMIPETKAFCPRGLGIIPYALPGSIALAEASLKELKHYDVVMWEKHGVLSVGTDIIDAFDQIDVLSKSALIYTAAKNMGYEPEGMTEKAIKEMKEVFGLPK